MLTGSLVYDSFLHFESITSTLALKNRLAVKSARDSLIAYMLLRDDKPFNIARPGGVPIMPRLLMLPCPDNLGDHNLDGSQDATCGANGAPGDMVRGILNSGSRFGRLPYKTNTTPQTASEREINDGLGADFHDAYGHRLWYAVSQNMVPATNNAPLNLHRLAVITDNWLSVGGAVPTAQVTNGLTVTGYQLRTHSKRVAAIVLAPGKNKAGRRAEAVIVTTLLNHGDISAAAYFESLAGQSNADTDGAFVQSPPLPDFDDPLAYIDMGQLLLPHGRFIKNYSRIVGVSNTHNAPRPHSPLAEVRQALATWKDFFGFYPLPAANNSDHVHTRFRHCAVFRTTAPINGRLAAAQPLLLPAAITVATPTAGGIATVSLQANSGFLTAQSASLNATTTLSRYARLTLAAGTPLLVDSALLQSIITAHILPAGSTVTTAGAANISLAASVLLMPPGIQNGWLPEHYRTTMIIGNDGTRLNLSAPTAAGFLSPAVLTAAFSTITVGTKDRLVLAAPGALKIEEDFAQLKFLYQTAVLNYAGGGRQTFAANGYHPTPKTYLQRQFVALLLSDIIRNNGNINAPAVVYPWRKKTPNKPAVTRDNLHPYPPCFDARRLPRSTRAFIENQNMHYAVAPACHYGDPANCGSGGGITLTLTANTTIALAKSFTLTHSYTATLNAGGRKRLITLHNGAASHNLTLPQHTLMPVIGTNHTVHIKLPAGFVFTGGATVTVAAGSEVSGGGYLDDIEALLIYSPAPLLNVACINNMPAPYTAAGHTVAAQGNDNAELTNKCEWLDDDENADGDLLYVLRGNAARAPPTNDFFMVFGGRLVVD